MTVKSQTRKVIKGKRKWTVLLGDSRKILRRLKPESIDSIVTDPPAGIEFMGQDWDSPWQMGGKGSAMFGKRKTPVPGWSSARNATCTVCKGRMRGSHKCSCKTPSWDESSTDTKNRQLLMFQDFLADIFSSAYRALKPGGYALVWAIPRTSHHTSMALERAGFEVRDVIVHLFGQGFPKSLNVSKAIDARGGDPKLLKKIARVLRKARKSRGWSVAQADKHFCEGTTAWGWWEGRRDKGVLIDAKIAKRVAHEWPETARVLKKARKLGKSLGHKTHARGGGDKDFGKVVGSKGVARTVEEFDSATPAAKKWAGWGTALKPGSEHWILCRKPPNGTIVDNVMTHGVGALNIDGCRIGTTDKFGGGSRMSSSGSTVGKFGQYAKDGWIPGNSSGRWPANVLLTHSPYCELIGTATVKGKALTAGTRTDQWGVGKGGSSYEKGTGAKHAPDEARGVWRCAEGCPVHLLDDQSGDRSSPWIGNANGVGKKGGKMFGGADQRTDSKTEYGDTGGASRFYYTGKTSTRERHEGAKRLYWRMVDGQYVAISRSRYERLLKKNEARKEAGKHPKYHLMHGNFHPTVKSFDLMAYLCRLVTPKHGVVLDPFTGSGSTGGAAMREGFRFIGVEQNEAFHKVATSRIAHQRKLVLHTKKPEHPDGLKPLF